MASSESNDIRKHTFLEISDTRCAICLRERINASHTDVCGHKFCLVCLKRWALINTSCPLCKEPFSTIYHSLNEDSSSSFTVPFVSSGSLIPPPVPTHHSSRSDLEIFLEATRSSNMIQPLFGTLDDLIELANINFRRRVYRDNLWSQPCLNMNCKLVKCDLNSLSHNIKAFNVQKFIERDISIIRQLIKASNRDWSFDINYMTDDRVAKLMCHHLRKYSIRDLRLVGLWRSYLKTYVVHFCHELNNFAFSRHHIKSYDSNVCYFNTSGQQLLYRSGNTVENATFGQSSNANIPPPFMFNTITLSSDDEETSENKVQEAINVDSDSDNDIGGSPSSFAIRTQPLSSFSEQPSTSVSIRKSFNDEPHNWKNERRKILKKMFKDKTKQTQREVNMKILQNNWNKRKRMAISSRCNMHIDINKDIPSED